MTPPWIVTTNTDRITLDAARHAELTFTVTNATDAADRVVFDAVPGEGVDPAALSVENPSRQVAGGASAAFLVRIDLGPQTAPGRYELHGQAYSAHLAPEETVGRSGRVVFDLVAAPEPKRKPWWLLVAAALVVVVLVVVLAVALRGNGAPRATPSQSPPTATVPPLLGTTQKAAEGAVTGAGLKTGTVRIRADVAHKGMVTEQRPAAGAVVAPGSTVDLVVAVDLATLPRARGVSPVDQARSATVEQFSWSPVPGVTHYQVVLQRNFCNVFGDTTSAGGANCQFVTVLTQQYAGTSATITIPPAPARPLFGNTTTVLFQWQVGDVDDFGAVGPPGAFTQFNLPG